MDKKILSKLSNTASPSEMTRIYILNAKSDALSRLSSMSQSDYGIIAPFAVFACIMLSNILYMLVCVLDSVHSSVRSANPSSSSTMMSVHGLHMPSSIDPSSNFNGVIWDK